MHISVPPSLTTVFVTESIEPTGLTGPGNLSASATTARTSSSVSGSTYTAGFVSQLRPQLA